MTVEEQRSKTIQLEAELVQINDGMREAELFFESTLTEVYNGHREQVDKLNNDMSTCDEDLQQGQAAMNQWRTQWEEELTEKNSIDAELLTLRSEFEKSSATCDRLQELAWRPSEQAIRISTLTMWGDRRDRDYPVATLQPSFGASGPEDDEARRS